MALGWNLVGWCTVAAIVLGFRFPAYVIDALKLEDVEKAQAARGKACATCGFLVTFFILLINS